MSQSQPDRLDRIEATLDRVSQQFDNQFEVNAELRTYIEVLSNSAESLKVASREQRLASEALLQTANQHNENFMVIVAEIRNMRQNMEQMQSQIVELRDDTRSLQAENSRILDRLENG